MENQNQYQQHAAGNQPEMPPLIMSLVNRTLLINTIINALVEEEYIEKIYCFTQKNKTDSTVQTNFIIIISEEDTQTFNEIKANIKFHFVIPGQLNFQLFKAIEFENLVSEGDIYYVVAGDQNNLVYDNDYYSIPKMIPDRYPNKRMLANHNFHYGTENAQKFYSLAKNLRYHDPNMAAFLLYHCAGHCLSTLLESIIGYEGAEQGLDELLKRAQLLNTFFSVLPGDDPSSQEDEMELLDRAKNCFRYSDPFQFHQFDLEKLFEKINGFMACVEETFKKWLYSYDYIFIRTAANG